MEEDGMYKLKIVVLSLVFAAAAALAGAPAPAQAGCLESVEAAINWGNGKAYFFGYAPGSSAMQYVRYDIKADKADAGYPKAVNDSTWPGLYIDYITAAINWGNGKAYIFGYIDGYEGLYYSRFDIANNRTDDGYPLPVTDEYWPGLSVLPDITAALDIGDGNVYFFGYNQDISYSQLGVTFNKASNYVTDYPEEVTYENMGGNLLTNITAAVDWSSRFYLFGWIEGDTLPAYERFTLSTGAMDSGYPRVTDAKMWPGLGCNY
jgi:hypothetical protein